MLAQRDQYLPLKVIKENLDALDRGLQPAANAGSAPTPRLATTDGSLAPSAFLEQSEMRLSKEELLSNSGLTEEQLVELESYGLIEIKGRHYDGDALIVAKVVAEIAVFGIEGRHLRAFKTAADRETVSKDRILDRLMGLGFSRTMLEQAISVKQVGKWFDGAQWRLWVGRHGWMLTPKDQTSPSAVVS